MLGKLVHRYFYILGLLVLIFGISLSPFLTSLGQFILAINWILEGAFIKKAKVINVRKGIIAFIVLYFVHVIWLFNTVNYDYALHDLKVKLPLLLLPIVLGTSEPLHKKEYNLILNGILMSVFIAALVQLYVFLGFTNIPAYDSRKASIFISHIRFSLVVLISVYINIDLLFDEGCRARKWKMLYYVLLVFLWAFIFIAGAYTGIVLFILTAPVYFLVRSKYLHKTIGKWLSIIAVGILIGSLVFIAVSYHRFNERVLVRFSELDKYTVNGHKYQHFNNGLFENKDLVWVYYCYPELKAEWKKRSSAPFHGPDKHGQAVKYTLIRYMTSKGLRKDSMGISQLTDRDIKNIENGMTNYLFGKKYAMYPKLYKILWQLERYTIGGNPSGHSITQRIEFSKNALRVFQRKLWLGTGTGDIQDEVKAQYEFDETLLNKGHRLRAHNQYITFIASFGVIGFSIILMGFVYFVYKERNVLDATTMVIIIIVLLSMLSEDTLETQAGATIASFYVPLFVFARNKSRIEIKQKQRLK